MTSKTVRITLTARDSSAVSLLGRLLNRSCFRDVWITINPAEKEPS